MLHNDDKFLLVALELLQTSMNICVKIWSDRKRSYQKRITMTNSSLRDFFFPFGGFLSSYGRHPIFLDK